MNYVSVSKTTLAQKSVLKLTYFNGIVFNRVSLKKRVYLKKNTVVNKK